MESKWRIIKHDMAKFIGSYNQIKRHHKSGTKKVDIIRMAKDLNCVKSAKNQEFMFEHCWELVKKFLWWADGVTTTRRTTLFRRVSGSSDHKLQAGSQVGNPESVSAVETAGGAFTSMTFILRPGGRKVVKEVQQLTRCKIK